MGDPQEHSVSRSDAGLARRISEQAFGKYTLIAKIGHGGMAEVFLAANRGPAGFTKLAVLKRLHPHLEEEPGLVGMFLDEARLAARLNHPHVVQTFEVGDAEGLHYLAMEYLEGQSLARILRHARRLEQPLPLAVGVRMFIDGLDGLQYAHSLRDFDGTPLNVVHRDISPGNIFVTYEGQVKLLDFGIAKAGTQINETRAGQVKGKFAYIAPEQARPGHHDHRADLWSFGVVMWEAFAGRRLFKGESEVTTLHNALNSQILSLDSEEHVPPELSAIVDRSLQRDPALRYPSAREMREDLEAFMHEAGLRASRSDIGTFVTGLFERERDEQRRVLKAYMAGEVEGQLLTPVPTTGSFSQSQVKGVEPDSGVQGPPASAGPGRRTVLLVLLLSMIIGGLLSVILRGQGEDEVTVATPGVAMGATPGGSTPGSTVPGSATGPTPVPTMEPDEPEVTAPETPELETNMTETATMAPEPEDPPARVPMTGRRPPRNPVRMVDPVASRMTDPSPMDPAPSEEFGMLTLDTVPWTQVSLGNRQLGTTPLIGVRLPVGSHTLTLVNPERGLRERFVVNIAEGRTTTRRVGLQ